MDAKEDSFLRRKFLHLYNCFDHDKKGFIEKKDAELQDKKLLDVLRRQMKETEANEKDIDKRLEEFQANWMPGAMSYFAQMSRFAKEGDTEKITLNDFIAFKMSIHEYVQENNALPSWFESSLRRSFAKCWSSNGQDSGFLDEEGLELLPGVVNSTRSICHHQLTDNNNKKIGISEFIGFIKEYYGVNDPEHISKYIHGYQDN